MTPVNYEATNWASLISQIRLMQLPSNSEPPLNTQVPGPMPGPSQSEQHQGEHVLQHRADEQQLEQSILRQHRGDDNNAQLNSTLSHCQALVCHSSILHNIIRFCTRHAPNANGHQRVVSSAGAQPVTSAERTSDQLATMMHQLQAIAHPPAQPTQQQPVAQPIQNSRQPARVILQPPGYIYNVTGLYKQIRYIDWLRSIMFTESQSWHRLTSFSFEFSSSNDPKSEYISDSSSAPAAFQQPAPAAQLHQMQGTQATHSQRQGPGARRRQNQINRQQQGNAPRCLIHNHPAPCSGCQRHQPVWPAKSRQSSTADRHCSNQPRLGQVDLAALDQ